MFHRFMLVTTSFFSLACGETLEASGETNLLNSLESTDSSSLRRSSPNNSSRLQSLKKACEAYEQSLLEKAASSKETNNFLLSIKEEKKEGLSSTSSSTSSSSATFELPSDKKKLSPQKLTDLGMEYASAGEYQKSFAYFQEAHKQKNVWGTFNLAIHYENGMGVTQDQKKAFNLYQEILRQNQNKNSKIWPRAQTNLALCYLHGKGVKKDQKKAFEMLKELDAMYLSSELCVVIKPELAKCYLEGLGTTKNKDKAVEIYQKAASQGMMRAGYTLASLKLQMDDEENILSAILDLHKYASVGEKDSMNLLGALYTEGFPKNVLKLNHPIAFYLFQVLAKQDLGHILIQDRRALAYSNLGACYYNGTGVETNEAEAARWFEAAANLGDPDMQHMMGMLCFIGYNGKRHLEKAALWFERSAAQGHFEALNQLGCLYREEAEDDQLLVKAFDSFKKASAGNREAKLNLAKAHALGEGTKKDIQQAKNIMDSIPKVSRDSTYYFFAAQVYNLLGNREKTIELLEKAREHPQAATLLASLQKESTDSTLSSTSSSLSSTSSSLSSTSSSRSSPSSSRSSTVVSNEEELSVDHFLNKRIYKNYQRINYKKNIKDFFVSISKYGVRRHTDSLKIDEEISYRGVTFFVKRLNKEERLVFVPVFSDSKNLTRYLIVGVQGHYEDCNFDTTAVLINNLKKMMKVQKSNFTES